MEMTPRRYEQTAAYMEEVFGRPDAQLAGLMERAVAAGLPDIAVSADVGRLLMLLTQMAVAGAARHRLPPRAEEVGGTGGPWRSSWGRWRGTAGSGWRGGWGNAGS